MHRVQSNEEKQTAGQIHEFCVNNWVQYTPTLLLTVVLTKNKIDVIAIECFHGGHVGEIA